MRESECEMTKRKKERERKYFLDFSKSTVKVLKIRMEVWREDIAHKIMSIKSHFFPPSLSLSLSSLSLSSLLFLSLSTISVADEFTQEEGIFAESLNWLDEKAVEVMSLDGLIVHNLQRKRTRLRERERERGRERGLLYREHGGIPYFLITNERDKQRLMKDIRKRK